MNKILEIIQADIKNKKDKYVARKFYSYKPSKQKDEMYIKNGIEYCVKGKKSEIYINYFKMLVTQKIDYLLSKKPTYDKKLDDDGLNVFTMLDKLLLNSSLDSQTWLHLYINNNQFDYIIVKDSEIIPEYTQDNKKLKSLIRYYKLDNILCVELWSEFGVKKMEFDEKNNLINEKVESHYTTKHYVGETLENSIDSNFKSIPFIKLENNKDVTSDLFDIECLIIAYNGICTGFVENVEKFQEALMVLRGYVGDKEGIKKIMKDIQDAKGVSVAADGSIDYMKVDIPVEARSALLVILRDVIFLIGRGVDPSKLSDGSNITNTVIKSRYIQLDFKASDCKKRIIDFYSRFIDFLNDYTNKKYDKDLELNEAMLINESEMIEDCIKSLNICSLKTVLKNHPWIEDVDEELKQIELENKSKPEDDFDDEVPE